MMLSDLLREELVLLPLEAADKWEAIAELARVPLAAGVFDEATARRVQAALVAREKSMTTGMEHGVAIPHAAVDEVDELVAVLGLSRKGIPFDTLDGAPARIVLCLVIPRAKKLLHIKTLAHVAKLLSREAVRSRLLACTSAAEVVAAMREAEVGR